MTSSPPPEAPARHTDTPLADNVHWTTFLEFAVPLHIAQLQARCGPDHNDWRRIRRIATELGALGDRLLFNGKTSYRDGPSAGELAGRVAEAIAVMAHQPGGVKIFGQHWQAQTPDDRLAYRQIKARVADLDYETSRRLAAWLKARHITYTTPGAINAANRWIDAHQNPTRRNHPSLGSTEPTW